MMREEVLAWLRDNPVVSVLIVGGGINGIGTFRDLALNDVDVLLIERGDFCSGASAASSHMAHGGIRYLENGEFRLVREAVQERNRLLQNAAHLVKPLPTTIPIFKRYSGLLNAPLKFLGLLDKPAERGALIIKLGLILYDAYTGRQRAIPRHLFLSRTETLARWPALNPDVINTATYYDGAILNPERLAIELIVDAEKEPGKAQAINYVSLVGAKNGSVTLRDELNGQEYEIHPKLLINAAGPWIDKANLLLGHTTHYIGGTKGSHLVLDNPELRAAIGAHEFFFENEDGRLVLILPLYDRVLIGTSDLAIEHPDEARCTDTEAEYFLAMVRRVFPGTKIQADQIVYRFSGVRPLAFTTHKRTSQITRDHSIHVQSPDETGFDFPIYSLVGGKWTTYRAFSEQVTNRALRYLGLTRRKNTRDAPIGGGLAYSRNPKEAGQQIDKLAKVWGLTSGHMSILYERYGTRSAAMAKYLTAGSDQPLRTQMHLDSSGNGYYTQREIAYLSIHEKVNHLEDVILRRTMLGMLGRLTRDLVDELAAVVGEALGWDNERRKSEVTSTLEAMADLHGVNL